MHTSCVVNALHGFVGSCVFGCLLQLFNVFLKFVRSKIVRTTAQRPLDIAVRLLAPENFHFPLFLGLLVGGYKGVLCAMRCARGEDDGWNAVTAGVASGWVSCRFLTVRSRQLLGLFLLSLAVVLCK